MQRFYGGPPIDWYHLPPAILRAYAAAIPAIRAEESLTRIADARVGTLSIKVGPARERVRALQRAAEADRRRRPANPGRLRAAGIRVEFRGNTTEPEEGGE